MIHLLNHPRNHVVNFYTILIDHNQSEDTEVDLWVTIKCIYVPKGMDVKMFHSIKQAEQAEQSPTSNNGMISLGSHPSSFHSLHREPASHNKSAQIALLETSLRR